jgi:hypothetical protein
MVEFTYIVKPVLSGWGRVEASKGFWWGNLRERGYLEDTGLNEMILLEFIFR